MRSDVFIEAVRDAGWRNINDAQHTGIKKLWANLFPSLAEAEIEIEELRAERKGE